MSAVDACKFAMRRAAAGGPIVHPGVGSVQPVRGTVEVRGASLHLYGAAMKRRHARVERSRALLQMGDSGLDVQRPTV